MTFYIEFSVTVLFEWPVMKRTVISDRRSIYVAVRASVDLKDVSRFTVDRVYECRRKENFPVEYPLDDSLIPDTRKTDNEMWAKWIIRNRFPENTEPAAILDPQEIIDHLGIQIRSECLSRDSSRTATTIFRDGTVIDTYDWENSMSAKETCAEGTIYIDPTTRANDPPEVLNSRLYHEIVHWTLHRPAMQLRYLIDGDTEYHQPSVPGTDMEEAVIEYQARAIAPMLQVRSEMLRERFDMLIRENSDEPFPVQKTIITLARLYRTSAQIMKIRLEQAGVTRVRGYMNWIDGHYAKPLEIRDGVLGEKEFFHIGLEDAFRTYMHSERFRTLLDSGNYIYADCTFALNVPEAVTIYPDGSVSLTEEATGNPEKYCIRFRLEKSTREGNGRYAVSSSTLFSGSSAKVRQIQPAGEAIYSSEPFERGMEELRLKTMIKDMRFTEFVRARKKELNLTNADLDNSLGLGNRGIENILKDNGKKGLTHENFVYLCFALKLTPNLAKDLAEVTYGYHYPEKDNPREMAARFFLGCLGCFTIDKVRENYTNLMEQYEKDYEATYAKM